MESKEFIHPNFIMTKISVIFLFIFLISSKALLAQTAAIPTNLDTLYISAINARMDLQLSSGFKYIELNENIMRIKSAITNPTFKFLAYNELGKVSVKMKQKIILYRVLHRVIAKDTIDINFGQVTFSGRRGIFFNKQTGFYFHKNEISLGCGGTNGYQPAIRFVFNKQIGKWVITKNIFLATK